MKFDWVALIDPLAQVSVHGAMSPLAGFCILFAPLTPSAPHSDGRCHACHLLRQSRLIAPTT